MAAAVRRGRRNIGVSLSATSLVAWLPRDEARGRGEAWSRSLSPLAPGAGEWSDLEHALRALASDAGVGELYVAVQPPLAQVRTVQLPPMEEEDALRVLGAGVTKYFVGAREPHVVSLSSGGRRESGANVAAAIPTRLIEIIRDAASASGFHVARLVPAQAAWLNAATLVWAKSDALVDHGRVVVLNDDRTEVLFRRDGGAAGFRHLRSLSVDGERLMDLVAQPSAARRGASANGVRPVAVIGSEAERRELAAPLRARGLHLVEPEGVWAEVMSSPALAAAHFAPLTEELEFVTDETRLGREQHARRYARILYAAAAVLLLVGAGAYYSGMRRELTAIQNQRAEIQQAVRSAQDGRQSIEQLTAPLADLRDVQANSVSWTLVLSDLAQYLPSDAFITSIKARGDSLAVDGQADDASKVLEFIPRAPSVASFNPTAQIVRNTRIDGSAFETFAFWVRLRKNASDGDKP